MRQKERNLVSRSHDAGPGCWSHRVQRATWHSCLSLGALLFALLRPWQHFRGTPGWYSILTVRTMQHQKESARQAGVPGGLQEQNTCTSLVTAVLSIVTKNLKHLERRSIGNRSSRLRHIRTKGHHHPQKICRLV